MATNQAQDEREHHWHDPSDLEDRLVHAPSAIIRSVRGVWSNFQDFIGRDNVLEVALGLIIAQAFTTVIQSLVNDVILPPIALLPFFGRNLPEKFAILRSGPHGPHYNTLEQAASDGAITLAYGNFISKLVNFFLLGFALYGIAQVYGHVSKNSIIKHTVKCAYCRKSISDKSTKCAFCCAWLDGREEKQTSALAPPGVTMDSQ
ncbi:gated mechanosensitive channel [Exidia glandulosa HHB12029]|uniref:Gated mechanosensitive channel n=1 Tax=Exidia glandulosa HHB12029 TaxID=1314781 RepID=A0A165EH72_EXIGL|nr:gated mechanosensitive channel [Exidia glandulosa HHB12029]KZV86924.1 gated mechanosensitive channel [Exidia glandulosa HHB12029]